MTQPPKDLQNDQPDAAETLKCPNCGKPYRIGELVCSNCNFAFVTSGRTMRVADPALAGSRTWSPGEAVPHDKRPIVFDIGGTRITLPVKEVISIGRASATGGDVPDVDLSIFDAENMGVSRFHIRIRRKGILLYVSDLGSTNGTHLNGRKLIAEGERVLRDGDELYLGRLCIKVRF